MPEKKNLCFHLPSLLSLHRFGDIYAQAIREIHSDMVTFEVIREAKDSIGAHWYGMRCRATSRESGVSFYFHTGLIFLPATKIGLMVELDERNNPATYDQVVAEIQDTALFTVNRQEKEYLKLFMPDETYARLNTLDAPAQKEMLAAYMKACAEAAAAVIDGQGFRVDQEAMLRAYDLGLAFRRVIVECNQPEFSVQINEKDPDNFGQYASGYRYWLENASETAKMYAYFGAIYSYKKRPAGIFAEIDWFSNQDVFDRVKKNFKPDPAFCYSDGEEKFIKLFMPQSAVDTLNSKPYEEQLEMLKTFFNTCSRALAVASESETGGE